MRKLSYLFMALSAMCLATPLYAQGAAAGGGMSHADWVAITPALPWPLPPRFAVSACVGTGLRPVHDERSSPPQSVVQHFALEWFCPTRHDPVLANC